LTIEDEINWILKEKDIEILRNVFLFTLNDIQQESMIMLVSKHDTTRGRHANLLAMSWGLSKYIDR
jgi:hypothetical protein